MIHWDDPVSWRCPVPGYLSVPQMLGPVIKHCFPGEWNGRERDVWLPKDGTPDREAWDKAAERRRGAFMVMQRGAADGSLPFVVYDPEQCSVMPFPAALWACAPSVALARFLRGAVSLDFPNHSAPKDPLYLPHFNATFLFNLYARNTDLVRWLQEQVSPIEQVENDPHGVAALDDLLLAAIAPPPPPADMMPPPPLPTPARGNRGYNWTAAEAALADWDLTSDVFAAVIANQPGGPKQAQIEKYLLDWFAQKFPDKNPPAESTVRARVGAMLQHRREFMDAQAKDKANKGASG